MSPVYNFSKFVFSRVYRLLLSTSKEDHQFLCPAITPPGPSFSSRFYSGELVSAYAYVKHRGLYSFADGSLPAEVKFLSGTTRRCFFSSGSDFRKKYIARLRTTDARFKTLSRKNKRISLKDEAASQSFASIFRNIFDRWFSGPPAATEEEIMGVDAREPYLSQPLVPSLDPKSAVEEQVAPLLARSNLVITRDIEWANLAFGFEQENRYIVLDTCYPKEAVGFIREHSNIIARQVLRLRRPFVAHITDAFGNELFRIRRPFWWITSSIYAEVDGVEVGVVHRRWHLWRRIYDLYLGNNQFAVVENPGFWYWTFTLKDYDGNVLAEIDRNWRGFGLEVFTDAGQYAIRFGSFDFSYSTEVEQLEVGRRLTLSERMVAVALAVSLDNDYFSRHGGMRRFPFVWEEA